MELRTRPQPAHRPADRIGSTGPTAPAAPLQPPASPPPSSSPHEGGWPRPGGQVVERSWWALAALVLVAAIVVSLVLAPGAVLTGRAGGQVPAAGRCAPPQLARGLCPPATARLGQKP